MNKSSLMFPKDTKQAIVISNGNSRELMLKNFLSLKPSPEMPLNLILKQMYGSSTLELMEDTQILKEDLLPPKNISLLYHLMFAAQKKKKIVLYAIVLNMVLTVPV